MSCNYKEISNTQRIQYLIASLRTAWDLGFDLLKDLTMYDDHLDGLRLALKGLIFKGVDD